jgi:galactose mutarotase-like enzyme
VADREMVTIRSDRLTAAINPYGAELSHLRLPTGEELMTDADPAFWRGRAPLLFPHVGALAGDALRIGDKVYDSPKHGFARRSLFDVAEQGEGHAVFVLTDSAETRARYPFAFRLEAAFRLDGTTLLTEITVSNPGDEPLPASFGFHPAFAWPLPFGRPRAEHRILFDADEPGPLREVKGNCLIAAEDRPSPVEGRTLPLTDDLFKRDALVWDPVANQALTYGAEGAPQLRIAFPDTPRLGIWTKPGAHFVCVEPWHGIASPDGWDGDFREKPGVWMLAPGEAKRMAMSVTLAD